MRLLQWKLWPVRRKGILFFDGVFSQDAFIFLLFALVAPACLFSQSKENLKEEIDKLIRFETSIGHQKTPGFIIGVIHGDSSFVFPYGSIRMDTLLPPDEHTVFETGSLTNVFTASLISILAAEGTMHFDSSINTYLEEEEQNSDAGHLSLLNFLSHTTGLPKLPYGIGQKELDPDQPYAHYSPEDLFEYFKEFQFRLYEKGHYIFSHTDYAILEKAIDNASCLTYEQLLKEKLLEPLGMKSSGITLSMAQAACLADGYDKTLTATPPWQFQSFGAALGLKSTVSDLLIFMRANMDNSYPEFNALHKPLYPTGIRKEIWTGAGWHVVRYKRRPAIITQTGTTAGHKATMAFVKESKTGVVILSNSPHSFEGLEFLILGVLNNNWKKKRK